jgi:hypothetical protein
MQALLARLYDAPVAHDVEDFLITDRARLGDLLGSDAAANGDREASDEQVILVDAGNEVRVGLFLDPGVIERLNRNDPTASLDDGNLSDYCTALEGVSHFHYLAWSVARDRKVSLLELELQADVDKYASALTLLTQQRGGCFPGALHARLFHQVSYLPQLAEESRKRYEEANRHAARFCRSLEEKFLRRRRSRPEAWVSELRRFFRCGHQEKLRQADGAMRVM